VGDLDSVVQDTVFKIEYYLVYKIVGLIILVSSEYFLKLSRQNKDTFGRYFFQDIFYHSNLINDFKSNIHNIDLFELAEPRKASN